MEKAMSFADNIKKLKKSTPACWIKKALSSDFFPFFTAAFVILCYYLSLDMVIIYYMVASGLLILFLLDDITPLFTLFLFMNVMISCENSPLKATGGSYYFFQPAILAQIIVLISIYLIAMFVRIAGSVNRGDFSLTPAFFGLIAFAAALLLNGAFAEEYESMDFVYGLFMGLLFVGVFVLISGNIKVNSRTFERIAISFIALSVLLLVELLVAYCTIDNIIIDGEVQRGKLMFGWGVYNTMGMLITISIPSAFYLAGRYKYGWPLTIYGALLLFAAMMTMSRQTMIGAQIVTLACAIMLLVKGKNRWVNFGILVAAAVAGVIYVAISWSWISVFFKSILSSLETGSGRLSLYELGLKNFKKYPIFGIGFYSDLTYTPHSVGPTVIATMYHNTCIQMLASCGAVGMIAYAVHRMQTIVSYIKNITVDRTFIAFTLAGMLILCLLDNHIFYVFPTLIYSALVAILIKSEKPDKKALL